MDWILGTLTLILGFYMAWNIGANDVANAMGTSVGSKALTLRKAVFLAAILEFAGAFLAGSSVSETIQRGIIDPTVFQTDPMIFVLGMMGALFATGSLLQLASYLALPISTTHAIVGAVVGFGLVAGGMDAVLWPEVGNIVASWVLSPLLSGLISYFIFSLIQRKILDSSNPLAATQRLLPYFVFFCFFIVSLSLFYNGLAHLNLNLNGAGALSIAGSIGLLSFLISYKLVQWVPQTNTGNQLLPSSNSVEKLFVYLQILSACLIAFAHGANDVANAIGPVAAIMQVLKTHSISAHSLIPSWLLALGGGGIVIGLATWGWRVIETIGKKITELTPTRGFAAEFGAAITILLASKVGMPISTTHALVGAVLGVGLTQGIKAINLQMVRGIFISWIVTIPLCAFFSIISFYILKFLII